MGTTLFEQLDNLKNTLIDLKESIEEELQIKDRAAKIRELIKSNKLFSYRYTTGLSKDLEIPKGNYVDDKFNKLK